MIKSKKPWTILWLINNFTYQKIKGPSGPLVLSIMLIEKYHYNPIKNA